MKENINKLIQLINKYDSIIIFGHINSDGDCYSSQIAMYEFITNNFKNKKVYLTGSGVRKMFSIFRKVDTIPDEIFFNSLGIAVDFNETYRSEDQRLFNCKEIAVIDHHNIGTKTITNCSYQYIDHNIASCCSILFILFSKLKDIRFSATMIDALYYGIASDTNRFMYLEKDAKSLSFAKKLIQMGANYKQIYDNIALKDLTSLQIKSYILSNYKYEKNLIYCFIDKDFKNKINYDGYLGSFVNVLANIEGFEAWILFIENDDNSLTCEFRSQSLPIIDVAIKYGGGGHDLACGIQKIKYEKDIISNIIKDTLSILDKSINGGK